MDRDSQRADDGKARREARAHQVEPPSGALEPRSFEPPVTVQREVIAERGSEPTAGGPGHDFGSLAPPRIPGWDPPRRAPFRAPVQRTDLSQANDRDALLDLIGQLDESGLLGNLVGRIRDHINGLDGPGVQTLSRAVDVVERKLQAEEFEDDTVDSDRKRLIYQARILVRVVTGGVSAELLSVDADEENMESQMAHFDVEDFADEVMEEDTAPADTEKDFRKELIDLGFRELAAEIEEADAALPDLKFSILVEKNKYLIQSDPDAWTPLWRAFSAMETEITSTPDIEAEFAAKRVRAVKAVALYQVMMGWKTITAMAELSAEELAALVEPDEATTESTTTALSNALTQEEGAQRAAAIERHRLDRQALRNQIQAWAENAEDPVLKNSCQWLSAGKIKVYAVTYTHDSTFRGARANKQEHVYVFPNFEAKGAGDIFSEMPNYNTPNYADSIVRVPKAFGGGQNVGMIAVLHPAELVATVPGLEQLRGTLVHEVQHDADLHGEDPLAQAQTEINAHLLENAHGRAIGYLRGVDAEETEDWKELHWNKRVLLIFRHLLISGGYQAIATAWEQDTDGFRAKVAAIRGARTPNPVNSLKIDAFNEAVRAITDGDFTEEVLTSEMKGTELSGAYEELTEDDLSAMVDNPATLALLEGHLQGDLLVTYRAHFTS